MKNMKCVCVGGGEGWGGSVCVRVIIITILNVIYITFGSNFDSTFDTISTLYCLENEKQ
jgi:hypothetical protein